MELNVELRVDLVCHRELTALVADIRARPSRYPVLPINPARARVHAGNPEALGDDPALLLVFADDRCMGYMGLMPQLLQGDTGASKVLAFSTLFVDPSLRGKRVADKLLEKARGLGPLLTIGNSLAAQAFFRKHGMRELSPFRIVYLPLGSGFGVNRIAGALRKRLLSKGLKGLAGQIEASGIALGRALSWPRAWSVGRHARRLPRQPGRTVEACARIPDEAAEMLVEQTGSVRWRVQSLNWLLQVAEPMVAASTPEPAFSHYHFGLPDRLQAHCACLLRENGQLRGLALFEVHRIHGQATVSILLVFVPDPDWLPVIVQHALQLAVRHRADLLRAGSEFATAFATVLAGATMPVRLRQSFVCEPEGGSVFTHYQESFADGDIALY